MKKQAHFYRKAFSVLAWAVILSLLVSGCGGKKMYHVGILSGSDSFAAIADGFKARMTELGYVEGQNISYDLQKTNNDRDGEKRVIQQFVDAKVDLMVIFPTDPALAAKDATAGTNIPVVFAHAGLEGNNLVESLQYPGGNLTGTRFPGPDLVVKRFDFMIQIDPAIHRLYVPYDKNYPTCAPALDALRPVAASTGVTLVEMPVTTLAEVEADLKTRAASDDIGIDGILIPPELLMNSADGLALLNTFASAHNLPLVASPDASIEKGSLLTYNVDPVEEGRMIADIVDKILRGTAPSSLPIATPNAHLKLNYKLAQKLGLTIPEGLLKMADAVIR